MTQSSDGEIVAARNLGRHSWPLVLGEWLLVLPAAILLAAGTLLGTPILVAAVDHLIVD